MTTIERQKKQAYRSSAWKKKNPQWYVGRNYVMLLEQALRRENATAKIWLLAGLGIDEWKAAFGDLPVDFKLAPIESWIKFDANSPRQVRAFLSPSNFKLAS